ncbi:MFS transporter [Chryseolinea soli]|uniref:MFS transporter n=1 Tax=Chryseolinea soli TaxID=2321403 RepID=A0A385SG27_9BACT|nr:MFS transporter [Chryseolinea soli]
MGQRVSFSIKKLTTQKIYNTPFWLLCLSSLLFFGSFNMIVPELPAYLTSLGGAEYKGLIIFLFTVTALLSRPFSGKLADRIGRKPVIMTGAMVCFVCSLIYPVLTTVMGFFLLRLMHGFSTGFTPTGQAAYLSDVIPANRRGEAMGILATAGSLGTAVAPAIADPIVRHFGLHVMFYCSSGAAIISMLVVLGIKETLDEKHPFGIGLLKVKRSDLFEPRVLKPAVVMFLSVCAYGAILTLLPDFGTYVGMHNKGVLFTYFTVAILFVRLLAGKASDRYGRAPVLLIVTFVIAIAMLVIAFAHDQTQLSVGIILYGLAYGATSPTLLAWATDLSDEHHRGRGIATLYIAMELGIGIGALVSGWLYGNDHTHFLHAFAFCSAMSVLAFVYLLFQRSTKKVSV